MSKAAHWGSVVGGLDGTPVDSLPAAESRNKRAVAYAIASQAHNKRAFLDELKDTWGKMDTGSKVTTGAGAALALASLVNQLRSRREDDEPNTILNLLGGLGGLGAAAYGLGGNDLGNILPTLSKITGIGGGNSASSTPAAGSTRKTASIIPVAQLASSGMPMAQLVGGLYGADKAQAEGDNSAIAPVAATLAALPAGTMARDRLSQYIGKLEPLHMWEEYKSMPKGPITFAEANAHPEKALAREYWANQKARKFAPAVGGAAASFLTAYLLQSLFGRDAKPKPLAPPPPGDKLVVSAPEQSAADTKKSAAYAIASQAHSKRAFLAELRGIGGR